MPDGAHDPVLTRTVCGQTLLLGNCLTALQAMPAQSVDVVVTSPPYNLSLAYGTYDDTRDEAEYIDWLVAICTEIRRVMQPQGSFFLNIAGSNNRPYVPFELLVRLRRIGFCLQNHITWIKSIATQTESRGHFKPIGGQRFMHHNHEHIFHLTLNHDVKLDRLSIGIPFQDKSNIARRGHERDLRCRGDTWFIPYSTVKSKAQKFNHPGTFPIELPLWCIYLHGVTDGVVLDPFVGTGTTLVAARLAGVRAIGIDIDPAYVETAHQRLAQMADGALDLTLDRAAVQALLQADTALDRDPAWQGFVAGLQKRTNKTTGHVTLTLAEQTQLRRYGDGAAGTMRQQCVQAIFGRHLPPPASALL
jgi:site-specific DNA-methyltransferase (adenine-specific)